MKNHLKKINASAICVSEFTPKNKVQSSISKWASGQFQILLTTERAYFYQISVPRKFDHVLFYNVPFNSHIFFELLSEVQSKEAHIEVYYSKKAMMELERIVGSVGLQMLLKEYVMGTSIIL